MTTTSLYDLTPGTRVTVTTAGPMCGMTGVVVEMLPAGRGGYEVAVQLDSGLIDAITAALALERCDLGFMARDLAVRS